MAFLLAPVAAVLLCLWSKKCWPFRQPTPPMDGNDGKAELENTAKPWVELADGERIEMHAYEPPKEFPDGDQNAELPGCTPLYELPANHQPTDEQR